MPGRKYYIFIFLFVLFPEFGRSQMTSSPYSIFALGQIENYGFGANNALGGTGIAFKSKEYLNNLNPASYSGLDSLSFLFEVGIFGKFTTYHSNQTTEKKLNVNPKYLAIAFIINNWWSSSVGIAPYSSVGYSINTTSSIIGQFSNYTKLYSGSGGINQVYMANSFKLVKNLSAGINASFLFGSIRQSESVASNNYFEGYSIDKTRYLHSFYLDYGMQYSFQLAGLKYTLGIVYGNSKELNTNNTYNVIYGSDTVNLESDKEKFYIPRKLGIGAAIEINNTFRIGFDYENKQWSAIKFSNPMLTTRNNERYSLGMEYMPGNNIRKTGLRRICYRVGANYNKSYLEIDHVPIDSKALTLGFGVPIRGDLSQMNVTFEVGANGTTTNALIKENYWLIHINLTFRDLWFRKLKID